MKEVNATELRQDLTSICNEILRSDAEFVITRYGEKVAVLMPYEKGKRASSQKVSSYS